MKEQIKNGGAAFPSHGSMGEVTSDGMTLRDYFATHADQPGVAEIVSAAGLTCPDGFNVWSGPDTRIGKFNEWWAGLPNAERFALSAKVRFQMADAMLAAREVAR